MSRIMSVGYALGLGSGMPHSRQCDVAMAHGFFDLVSKAGVGYMVVSFF